MANIEIIITSTTTHLLNNLSRISNLRSLKCINLKLREFNYDLPDTVQNLDVSNNLLTSFDMTKYPHLISLNCSFNQIKLLKFSTAIKFVIANNNLLLSLDLTNAQELTYFSCESNKLSSVRADTCTKLTKLNCSKNKIIFISIPENLELLTCKENLLSSLNLSYATKLKSLDVSVNKFKNLYLGKCFSLKDLHCNNNELENLDFSNCPDLDVLQAYYNNISELNTSGCDKLRYVNITKNNLLSLDITSPELAALHCRYNRITKLNLRNLTKLVLVDCSNNNLYKITIANNHALEKLYINDNVAFVMSATHFEFILEDLPSLRLLELKKMSFVNLHFDFPNLQELNMSEAKFNSDNTIDFSKLPNLRKINADDTRLVKVNFNSNVLEEANLANCKLLQSLTVQSEKLKVLQCNNCALHDLFINKDCSLQVLNCANNELTTLDLSHVLILDELKCENNLLQELSTPNNCTVLSCDNNKLNKLSVVNSLTSLSCANNKNLTVDIRNLPDLTYLNAADGKNSAFDFSHNLLLQTVNVNGNKIKDLDVHMLRHLKVLICQNNLISVLKTNDCPLLEELNCTKNRLEELNLSYNENLRVLLCAHNKLTSLRVDNLKELKVVDISFNQLTTLPFSILQLNNLSELNYEHNDIKLTLEQREKFNAVASDSTLSIVEDCNNVENSSISNSIVDSVRRIMEKYSERAENPVRKVTRDDRFSRQVKNVVENFTVFGGSKHPILKISYSDLLRILLPFFDNDTISLLNDEFANDDISKLCFITVFNKTVNALNGIVPEIEIVISQRDQINNLALAIVRDNSISTKYKKQVFIYRVHVHYPDISKEELSGWYSLLSVKEDYRQLIESLIAEHPSIDVKSAFLEYRNRKDIELLHQRLINIPDIKERLSVVFEQEQTKRILYAVWKVYPYAKQNVIEEILVNKDSLVDVLTNNYPDVDKNELANILNTHL